MKRVARLLGFLGLVCLLASCGKRSFITDTSYRQRVEQDFNQKKERLPQGDLFAIFDTDLTSYEREALEFLYAYMPLADIADYSGEFHLMNVRASQKAADEMPWGKVIPEDLFRHFVLPVRVNNEFNAKLIPASPEPITRKSNFLTMIICFMGAKLRKTFIHCTFYSCFYYFFREE